MTELGLLLLAGAVGGPLFVITFLLLGAWRAGYDPLRQPVSALAMGPLGWTQQANFIVTAAFMLAGAVGIHLALAPGPGCTWGPILIGVFAVGLFGAGVFVTDLTGLPGERPAPSQRSRPAVLHDLFSLIAFLALFMACFVLSAAFAKMNESGWAIYSLVSGISIGVGFVLFARAFSRPGPLAPIAGLLQRLTIAIGWIWASAVAAHLLLARGLR
jgi:hypothetical protein